jgi:hypothetical protein
MERRKKKERADAIICLFSGYMAWEILWSNVESLINSMEQSLEKLLIKIALNGT